MPELFVIGILLGMLYFGVRICVKFLTWISRTRHKAYRQLASRYHGRYESRGMSDPPTVSFRHRGSNVRVGLAPVVPGGNQSPRTRVVARFDEGIPFRLELAPITRPAPAQAPKGTRLVKDLESEFQRNYVIQANDVEMAHALLQAPRVRQAIESLRRLAPPSGMLVSINPERMLVQVDRNLGTLPEGLLVAVREALEIHDAIRGSVESRVRMGIAIVSAGEPPDEEIGAPVCKVCGDSIDPHDVRVTCSSCNTPHHKDCWEFVGACSVYGCQSKRGRAS